MDHADEKTPHRGVFSRNSQTVPGSRQRLYPYKSITSIHSCEACKERATRYTFQSLDPGRLAAIRFCPHAGHVR